MKVIENVEMPHIKDDEVLVQVHCVRLDLMDAQSADPSPSVGANPGCEFAGELVTVRPAVKRNFCVSDIVCGCVFENHAEVVDSRAFAENVVVPGMVFKFPSTMSLQTAWSRSITHRARSISQARATTAKPTGSHA